MSELQVIEEGRRAAEARMVTTCTISRDGVKTWDPVSLSHTDVDVVPYSGKCRLKSVTQAVADRTQEGQIVVDQDQSLYIPIIGTESVRIDDIVTITSGGPDASLTGRRFRVTGLHTQTWATARRLPVESITTEVAA